MLEWKPGLPPQQKQGVAELLTRLDPRTGAVLQLVAFLANEEAILGEGISATWNGSTSTQKLELALEAEGGFLPIPRKDSVSGFQWQYSSLEGTRRTSRGSFDVRLHDYQREWTGLDD